MPRVNNEKEFIRVNVVNVLNDIQRINKSLNNIIMIFINPQWQGSGFTDDLKLGAELFISYFKDSDTKVILLSTKGLTTIANIKSFEPILEQTKLLKK
jgi:hypothetical protein